MKARIHKLQWDSELFGYNVGSCTFLAQEDQLDWQEEAKCYRLVYVYSKAALPYMEPMTQQLLYATNKLQHNSRPKLAHRIVSFDPRVHEETQLIRLALESGSHSRFKVDPHFKNHEFDKLYRQWIRNTLSGQMGFAILVAVVQRKLLGFLTLQDAGEQLAQISLMAVHPEARNQGIGLALIHQAMDTARHRGFQQLQVGTQGNNIPARSLYQKAGFELVDLTYVYHYWHEDTL